MAIPIGVFFGVIITPFELYRLFFTDRFAQTADIARVLSVSYILFSLSAVPVLYFLYTLKKVKDKEQKQGEEKPWDIAFVSYSGHLKRFEDFEKEAIKKGLFDKNDFRFHKISTGENKEEKGYENNPLRRLLHRLKLLTMGKYKLK